MADGTVETTKGKSSSKSTGTTVQISAPNFQEAVFWIEGTSELVINKFSTYNKEQMQAAQAAGSQAKSKRKRDPKDFTKACEDATYRSKEGWPGVNAVSFRNAMIGACRLVGYKMTVAKLSVFVEAEGHDALDGTPLIQIHGEHVMRVMPARNDNGSIDLRARNHWAPGWRCRVHVRWDNDQFSVQDVTNLLTRVGMQCGVGAGRPSSTNSSGLGWGLFRVLGPDEQPGAGKRVRGRNS